MAIHPVTICDCEQMVILVNKLSFYQEAILIRLGRIRFEYSLPSSKCKSDIWKIVLRGDVFTQGLLS